MHSVHTLDNMSTAYVCGRVPARYERLVTKQARAARTSKSDLVARYVIEKSLETEFPGISFRDSLSGRPSSHRGLPVTSRQGMEFLDWNPVEPRRLRGGLNFASPRTGGVRWMTCKLL